MSPLRWEVLGLAFVLALPVLAMGMRGDLTFDDVVARLPWCLAAAWAAVALLAAVARPRPGEPQGARLRRARSPPPPIRTPVQPPSAAGLAAAGWSLLRCSSALCGAAAPQTHEEHRKSAQVAVHRCPRRRPADACDVEPPGVSAPDPGRPLLRRTALEQGLSDDELARMVRRRELVRLQRGAYLEPGRYTDDRLRLVATVAGLRVPGVVSHASAALLHGLPLWRVPTRRVHVTRRPPTAGSGSARVHLHVARLPDDQVEEVDGLPVTDVTRTVVDLARTSSFESAVIAADAALARELTTPELLDICLAEMGPVPGTRRAARVLDFADAGGRSVGESRSRVLIHRLGLPAPRLQVEVHRPDGGRIGICDFGWEDERTVAEFDGRIKYGRLLRPGQDPGDAVFVEKCREDDIRDVGREVARWVWADLDVPRRIGDRLHRAFARGRRRP